MANAIRSLTLDAVHLASSGHPGMPLGMADVAAVLFADFLKFNSNDPLWISRDRFILSAGHGSMLLYSVLYLTGYITLEDIKNFRKLHSKTAGHPEYSPQFGIENTSGPLGQGLGMAVGIALAERILNAKCSAVDHYTYVVCSDGCLMEGISHESAALAGHLGLNKLILLFDDNGISIDGSTMLASSENVRLRFESYNWNVIDINGHDYSQIRFAIKSARVSQKPSLVCCRTIIGKSISKIEASEVAHSYTPKNEDILCAKNNFGWAKLFSKQKNGLQYFSADLQEERVFLYDQMNSESKSDFSHEPFSVPEEILQMWAQTNKVEQYEEWSCALKPEHKKFIADLLKNAVTDSFLAELKSSVTDAKYNESTRKSSGRVIDFLSNRLLLFIGGSADLSKSNCIKPENARVISKENYDGNFIHYGIREHAMAACMNGLAVHSNIIPYGGTFLIFSDYARPAIRMAALMKLRIVFVMTHDSIGVGEDGPTHQPIEHLASFRAMPNVYLFRPCDAEEVVQCWDIAVNSINAPSIIALSRQDVRFLNKDDGVAKSHLGAYIIDGCDVKPDFIIFATGSEVEIAIHAKQILCEKGFAVRVVSVPCVQLFNMQSSSYIESVIGDDFSQNGGMVNLEKVSSSTIRVAIEAASSFGWDRFIGKNGIFIGIDEFGSSASYSELYEYYKITAGELAKKCLAKKAFFSAHSML